MEPPARLESIEMPAAALVPKVTVAPGAMLSDVAVASFAGAPPGAKDSSTPTCVVTVSVEVQEKKVANPRR